MGTAAGVLLGREVLSSSSHDLFWLPIVKSQKRGCEQICLFRLAFGYSQIHFMQDESSNSNALADARSASIKLVFKKAMLSKLGQTASSVVQHLKDENMEDTEPGTPKTTEKKSEKQAARGNSKPQKVNAVVSKATPSKGTKSPSSTAQPKSASKKVAPQKQKRTEHTVDASSITSDLGVAVLSSTAGLDLTDAASDALPLNRIRRTMKDLLGDVKISNESVAAIVFSCHGLINYMTTQVARCVLLLCNSSLIHSLHFV
jgi:hypothetical protein